MNLILKILQLPNKIKLKNQSNYKIEQIKNEKLKNLKFKN
jgi:hypothetical protein